jgi:hypothetical protein
MAGHGPVAGSGRRYLGWPLKVTTEKYGSRLKQEEERCARFKGKADIQEIFERFQEDLGRSGGGQRAFR